MVGGLQFMLPKTNMQLSVSVCPCLVSVSDALTSWRLAASGGTVRPEGWLMPRESQQLACESAFMCQPTNPEPIPLATSFIKLLNSRAIVPYPHLRTKNLTTKDSHYVPEPTGIFQTSQF